MRKHHLAGVAAALLTATPCVASERTAIPPMPMGSSVTPPPGFVDLCRRSPVDCQAGVERVAQEPRLLPVARSWALGTSEQPRASLRLSPGAIRQTDELGDRRAAPKRLFDSEGMGWGLAAAHLGQERSRSGAVARPSELSARLQAPSGGATLSTRLVVQDDWESDDKPFHSMLRFKTADRVTPISVFRPVHSTAPRDISTPNWNLSLREGRATQQRPAELIAEPQTEQIPASSARSIRQTTTSADILPLLTAVNRRLNREIRRSTDDNAFGRADYWTRPTGSDARGDCEDYVLAKRQALISEGLSALDMSIAIVRTRQQEVHAVLLVRTDQGEYVLDNLSPWVVPWTDAPYEWIQRQQPGRPMEWVGAAPSERPTRRGERAIVLRIASR